MGIKQNLIDEFNDQLKIVHEMEVGDEKYKTAVDGITKLADRIIELEKLEKAEAENDVKWESINIEHDLKTAQLKLERRDRLISNVIEGLKVGSGVGLTVWGYLISMRFERDGLIPTTEGGRSALRSLFKFIK